MQLEGARATQRSCTVHLQTTVHAQTHSANYDQTHIPINRILLVNVL